MLSTVLTSKVLNSPRLHLKPLRANFEFCPIQEEATFSIYVEDSLVSYLLGMYCPMTTMLKNQRLKYKHRLLGSGKSEADRVECA